MTLDLNRRALLGQALLGQIGLLALGACAGGGGGMAEVEAWGRVYGLSDLYRFPGAYAEARSGFVLGTVGQGQLWLQNESGVFLHLAAQREGLMLSFGADAMVIQMA